MTRRKKAAEPLASEMALAHDYITQKGGAEKVVLALAKTFPDAPIYTMLYDPDTSYPEFRDLDIRTSPLNKIRFFRKHHRAALPIFPLAAQMMKINANVVLCSSSGWSHGYRATGLKIVYCYSPARWLYQGRAYLGGDTKILLRLSLAILAPPLRRWDKKAASSADKYLAISTAVRGRILETYGVDSQVIPAPFSMSETEGSVSLPEVITWLQGAGYVLCVSRLLPYKNVDKVVKGLSGTPQRLIVVGRGPDQQRVKGLAQDNVLFLSDLTDAQMRWLYKNARGLVSASFEDYGLTPLEAGYFGKPSAVLRWGGFLDTVVENETGLFFDSPDPQLIQSAVSAMLRKEWCEARIKSHVATFDEESFGAKIKSAIFQAAIEQNALRMEEGP